MRNNCLNFWKESAKTISLLKKMRNKRILKNFGGRKIINKYLRIIFFFPLFYRKIHCRIADSKGSTNVTETILNSPLVIQFPEMDVETQFFEALSETDGLAFHTALKEYEISPFPEFIRPDWQRTVPIIDNWSAFR